MLMPYLHEAYHHLTRNNGPGQLWTNKAGIIDARPDESGDSGCWQRVCCKSPLPVAGTNACHHAPPRPDVALETLTSSKQHQRASAQESGHHPSSLHCFLTPPHCCIHSEYCNFRNGKLHVTNISSSRAISEVVLRTPVAHAVVTLSNT